MSVDLAIGIDVGFSATRRSTGVVILDRQTKSLVHGSTLRVDTVQNATTFVAAEVARLQPRSATACVEDLPLVTIDGTRGSAPTTF